MKLLKHKISIVVLAVMLLAVQGLASITVAQPVNAYAGSQTMSETTVNQPFTKKQEPDDCKQSSYKDLNQDNCQFIKIIAVTTKALSGIAGLVIIAMIIVGGIQYSMAAADASKVQAAKQKIINALTALLLLIFGFAILQWLVPGGIF